MKSKRPRKKNQKAYVHGFNRQEQDRLYRQARFLEESVYHHVDFSKQSNVIEVACGVGAQTEILTERFPNIRVQGLDASPTQLKRAKAHLSKQIRQKRVKLDLGDATHLPYPDNHFDGAFVCWFLEHLEKPGLVLKEIRRVLKPGGVLYCTEVMNATFYLHPYSPATLKFWFEFNDFQWNLKGDPFVGGKLANLLLAAGYQNITTEVKIHHYDARAPKRRAQYLEDIANVLLSGAPQLIEAGKVTPALVEEMQAEIERLKKEPDAVFFNSWVQARAEVY